MDLSDLDFSNDSVMTLVHPATGEPVMTADGKPVTFTLIGADSEEAIKAKREAINRRIADKSNRPVRAEFIDDQAITLLSRCFKAWSGVTWEGKQLTCSPENAAMIMRKRPWIREQVDAFVSDRANFTPA